MKPLHAVIIFALISLSCIAPTLPAAHAFLAPQLGPAPVPTHEYVVVAKTLNVRTAPNGVVLKYYYLRTGDPVTVYKRTPDDWCRITVDEKPERWVYCKWLK